MPYSDLTQDRALLPYYVVRFYFNSLGTSGTLTIPHNRVMSLSDISKNISIAEGESEISDLSIQLSDNDGYFSGTWRGRLQPTLLNSYCKLEYQYIVPGSSLGASGDTLFRGKVSNYQISQGVAQFEVVSVANILKDADIVFQYGQEKAIYGLSGTQVFLSVSDAALYSPNDYCQLTPGKYGYYEIIGTSEGGQMNNGTFVSNGTGTINLGTTPIEGFATAILRRQPLSLIGNPADLFLCLVAGSHSSFGLDPSGLSSNQDIDMDALATSRRALTPAIFRYETRRDGKLYDILQDLCRASLSSLYMRDNGKLVFQSFSPKQIGGTTGTHFQGAGNILGPGLTVDESFDRAYNKVSLSYGVDEDPSFEHNVTFTATSVIADSLFGTIGRTKEIRSAFISDHDTARCFALRALHRCERGIPEVYFDTGHSGLYNDVGELIRVTHPTGNLGTTIFEIHGITRQGLTGGNAKNSIRASDGTYLYGLYAYWMAGLGTGGQGSGTSSACWGTIFDSPWGTVSVFF